MSRRKVVNALQHPVNFNSYPGQLFTVPGLGNRIPTRFYTFLNPAINEERTMIVPRLVDQKQTACPNEPSLFLEGKSEMGPIEADLVETTKEQIDDEAKAMSENAGNIEDKLIVSEPMEENSVVLNLPRTKQQVKILSESSNKKRSADNIDLNLVPARKQYKKRVTFARVK